MNYIDYLTTSFASAWSDAQTRWANAITEIRAGTYTADKWVSDMAGTWLNGAQPWWNVWGTAVDVPMSVLGFNVAEGTTGTQTAFTNILPPLGTPPAVHCTDVLRIGGTQKLTGDTDATATLTEGVLQVQLANMSALPKGDYQGAVYLAGTVNRVVALVFLVVS